MTRIAALYDIHGNLAALEAVLADLRGADVNEVVVGGDVYPGPQADAVLEMLLALDIPCRFIRGNGDRVVLDARAGAIRDRLPPAARDLVERHAATLPPRLAEAIASWPETLHMELPGHGRVLFVHATPENDTDVFTAQTPAETLLPMFDAAAADLVVCGHTHVQFDRRIGATRVINAGSVGMPFEEPGAYWLLLSTTAELRRTSYVAADSVIA